MKTKKAKKILLLLISLIVLVVAMTTGFVGCNGGTDDGIVENSQKNGEQNKLAPSIPESSIPEKEGEGNPLKQCPQNLEGQTYILEKQEFVYTVLTPAQRKINDKKDAIEMSKGLITESSTESEVLAFIATVLTKEALANETKLIFEKDAFLTSVNNEEISVASYKYKNGLLLMPTSPFKFGDVTKNKIVADQYVSDIIYRYIFKLQTSVLPTVFENIKKDTVNPVNIVGRKFVLQKLEYCYGSLTADVKKIEDKTEAIKTSNGTITANSTEQDVLNYYSSRLNADQKGIVTTIEFEEEKIIITVDGKKTEEPYVYCQGFVITPLSHFQVGVVNQNGIATDGDQRGAICRYYFI